MDQQINESAPQSSASMLARASLRYHSPEEIYDYVFRNVGPLGMKIKKKQAIIGFQAPQDYERLMKQHKVVMLLGKRLEFKPLSRSQENFIPSDEQEVIIETIQEISAGKPGITFPQFDPKNSVEAKVNICKQSMMEKIQNLFIPTIEATRQRVQQLKLQYREKGPLQREMFALESALQKKLRGLEGKYEADIQKINKFIQDFSMKPSIIDLEPTFQFQQSWEFPKIPYDGMKFQPAGFYTNKDSYQCKRMCAINSNEFVVSMANPKKNKGFLKIYDLNEADPKKIINLDPGAYGLCRVNNFLLAGSYDNTIKYINIEDQEQQVQPSRQLTETPNTSFFDIKLSKPAVDRPEILTLNTDGFMRKFELSFDEITEGVFSANFDLKMELNVETNCLTFELINSNVVLYGGMKKIRKYQMEKKLFKDIPIAEKAIKIKKFNHNLYAVASNRIVQMVDLRTEDVVQKFAPMNNEIRTIQVIGEHSIMYGANAEIGLLDDRKHQVFPWKSEKHHKGMVYDILKLKNRIVSCDSQGTLYSWKLCENSGRVGNNPEQSRPQQMQIQYISV